MKRLRKRNADLVTLTKTLEERCKVLKMENTKMVCYELHVHMYVIVMYRVAREAGFKQQ